MKQTRSIYIKCQLFKEVEIKCQLFTEVEVKGRMDDYVMTKKSLLLSRFDSQEKPKDENKKNFKVSLSLRPSL